MPTHIVVMGVSGSGKTVVGQALAARLGLRFEDADDLHPTANITKMRAGIPLTDEDRAPWLRHVGEHLAASPDGLVMACSALKERYRDLIRASAPEAEFVLLTVDESTLTDRVKHRPGHFMPASLVHSQLDALEPLHPGEIGVTVLSSGGIEATAEQVEAALNAGRALPSHGST